MCFSKRKHRPNAVPTGDESLFSGRPPACAPAEGPTGHLQGKVMGKPLRDLVRGQMAPRWQRQVLPKRLSGGTASEGVSLPLGIRFPLGCQHTLKVRPVCTGSCHLPLFAAPPPPKKNLAVRGIRPANTTAPSWLTATAKTPPCEGTKQQKSVLWLPLAAVSHIIARMSAFSPRCLGFNWGPCH